MRHLANIYVDYLMLGARSRMIAQIIDRGAFFLRRRVLAAHDTILAATFDNDTLPCQMPYDIVLVHLDAYALQQLMTTLSHLLKNGRLVLTLGQDGAGVGLHEQRVAIRLVQLESARYLFRYSKHFLVDVYEQALESDANARATRLIDEPRHVGTIGYLRFELLQVLLIAIVCAL